MSDDNEPITREWLAEAWGAKPFSFNYFELPIVKSRGDLLEITMSKAEVFSIYLHSSCGDRCPLDKEFRTRGSFRVLIEALT